MRLFELFRGTRWTLLRHGATAPETEHPAQRAYVIGAGDSLRDVDGDIEAAYRLAEGFTALIRPDGYVGLITSDPQALRAYRDAVFPPPGAAG